MSQETSAVIDSNRFESIRNKQQTQSFIQGARTDTSVFEHG